MKIMAIDYGDAHTGIAISDATGTLAGFTTVIDSRKAEVVVQEILRLLPEHGVTELVLGYPKNMDGTVGPRAEKAAAFAETHSHMQIRLQLQVLQRNPRALLCREMRRNQIRFNFRRNLTRRQRRRIGEKTIQHNRQST